MKIIQGWKSSKNCFFTWNCDITWDCVNLKPDLAELYQIFKLPEGAKLFKINILMVNFNSKNWWIFCQKCHFWAGQLMKPSSQRNRVGFENGQNPDVLFLGGRCTVSVWTKMPKFSFLPCWQNRKTNISDLQKVHL